MEHSCEVWMKLAMKLVYEKMLFKVKVYGRRTTDGRRTDAGRKAITKAHPVTK
jgi:hypothetical protein